MKNTKTTVISVGLFYSAPHPHSVKVLLNFKTKPDKDSFIATVKKALGEKYLGKSIRNWGPSRIFVKKVAIAKWLGSLNDGSVAGKYYYLHEELPDDFIQNGYDYIVKPNLIKS